jgi:rRNA biogenesis protein RRP5
LLNTFFNINTQVLTVNPEKRRLQLTHKKTLVSSTLPILTQYDDAKRGMATHGFITSLRENGCLVTFYNNVKGFITKAELG